MLSRRTFLQAAGAAAGLGVGTSLLAGCGGGSPSAASPTHAPATGAPQGDLTVWDWSPAPDVYGEAQQKAFYSTYFPGLYKNLTFHNTVYGYTDFLPKVTVAWRGGTTPDAGRFALAWSPQFVNQGVCAAITEADIGIPMKNFWPQALQTVRRTGAGDGDPLYGIPTNNEAMLLIYNKDLLKKAGLPDRGPTTWSELVSWAKQIKTSTGAYGFGLPCAQNNGNTPYRFMPMAWAHGGSIFDELESQPTWKKIGINSDGVIKALQYYNQMYNVDHSMQSSALSDAQSDVDTLFLNGKVAMMIDHPNAAADVHSKKPSLPLGGALIPAGPVRRAVVFGGSNIHILAKTKNLDAAMAYVRAYLSPEWNTRLSGLGSNPGNKAGYTSQAQTQRNKMLLFNDVTLKMMQYGVNVPLVAQSTQIWNQVIPTMVQSVLTKQSQPQAAAAAAESQIKSITS